jgi:uncharacterized protein (DUF2225 family)/CheY-like chemotaxis protein
MPYQGHPRQCLILCRDPLYTVLFEMTVREFTFAPRLTTSLEQVEQLSGTAPTLAWIIDLDHLGASITDVAGRARRAAPDAKLVFLSSSCTRELVEHCKNERALALLAKPISATRLAQALNLLRQEIELVERDDTAFPSLSRTDEGPLEPTEELVPPCVEDFPHLFASPLTCPLCGRAFEAWRWRTGAMPVFDTDTDFCPICPDSVHPELFSVAVCPSCLFATYVGKFEDVKVPEVYRQAFLRPVKREERQAVSIGLEFNGPRTHLHGVKSFELAALATLDIKQRGFLKRAGEFHLKCSWLCRRLGHSKHERSAQERALEFFQQAYEPYLTFGGSFPSATSIAAKLSPGHEALTERGIIVTGFLTGELARRLGNVRQARAYFEEVRRLPFLSKFTSLVYHVNGVMKLLDKNEAPPQKASPQV